MELFGCSRGHAWHLRDDVIVELDRQPRLLEAQAVDIHEQLARGSSGSGVLAWAGGHSAMAVAWGRDAVLVEGDMRRSKWYLFAIAYGHVLESSHVGKGEPYRYRLR